MANDIESRITKFYAKHDPQITINAAPGHFAAGASHTNFYIDITRIKVRVSEAKEAAKALRERLQNHVYTVDTIVCLDGTELLGGFLADELERSNFQMTNKHETMYVVTPEENSVHQFMFRQNNRLAIEGKYVLLLVDNISTGGTERRAMECIRYYGGLNVGIAAIFSTMNKVDKKEVYSLFTPDDIPGYQSYPAQDCPLCAKKIPVDAIVNGYGYAKL